MTPNAGKYLDRVGMEHYNLDQDHTFLPGTFVESDV
jgi:hypothetical protein